MPRRTDARERAIRSAARLFQRQGYHGTGLAQILEESGAPRGSFYFHFPQGKPELAVEAVREATRDVEALVTAARERARDPAQFLRRLARGLARWLEETDYAEGCPVAAFTLEGIPEFPPLEAACVEAYARWKDDVVAVLEDALGRNTRSEGLATLVVAAFEGALLMGRTQRSVAPVETVGEHLAAYVRALSRA